MTLANQTSTRSKDEIRILAPWAYSLFTTVFLTMTVLYRDRRGHGSQSPSLLDPLPASASSAAPCSAATPC